PGEAAAVERASPARRREFAAGRALARRAMAALDVTASAIPAAEDRAPVWPLGITGSISHCADWCVAAAARADDGYLAIGVDIEPAEPLDADLIEEICTAEERLRLDDLPAARRDLLARMIFCAKECAYKCQYPLSGALFDFQALSIGIDEIEQFQQKCAAVLRPEL
ncbi:4'-phosphopantetheinyl transferase, partial [Rhizobiaceae sp. 2RAB30]